LAHLLFCYLKTLGFLTLFIGSIGLLATAFYYFMDAIENGSKWKLWTWGLVIFLVLGVLFMPVLCRS
jgi:hypothetical protein